MIGTSLAQYRITAALGAGGMGEVWRAEDTKLGREVALKVLPSEFAEDPERMARFEREAKVLASLNHPNIAILFGLETAENTNAGNGAEKTMFLIMELVEGEDLSERIPRGPVPSTRRFRSHDRSPTRWRRRTRRASSIAISNRPTSSSRETARSRCWISDWQRRGNRIPATRVCRSLRPSLTRRRRSNPRHRSLHEPRAGSRSAGGPPG